MNLSAEQKTGVDLIAHPEKIGIVTGGPGTGKTTILREAVKRLAQRGASYMLLAPTGKAARRMSEVTATESYTIHRALGALAQHVPDIVIVDEASMVDTSLLATLIRALRPSTKMILIGDVNQLPSIGPGTVFADLIDSGEVPVVRLTQVHRSGPGSWVCNTAPMILNGRIDLNPTDDFSFIESRDMTEAQQTICEIIEHHDGKDIQVLTPMHRGLLGTKALNFELQRARRFREGDDSPGVEIRGGENPLLMFKGDPVMQITNDYDRRIFNGEAGKVDDTGISETKTNGPMLVQFDSGLQVYNPGQIEENLQLSYAITIHKSQGSEYKTVVLVCHDDHGFMWNRQLLYTGLTRAKERVYVVGTKSAVQKALQIDQPKNRLTTLKERIRE